MNALSSTLQRYKEALAKQLESEKLLTQERDEARADTQTLRSQIWDGFDPEADDYPEELDLAFTAWRAIHNARDVTKTPKEQVKGWLDANSPSHISGEAKERIATICNWDKKGGRPKG